MKLIIVESPTKARTISRFLKDGYEIMATMGHIRDLPKKKFGIEVIENGEIKFRPQYQIIPEKKKVVVELKKKIGKSSQVILATDPDREGEAIAYHVKVIGSKVKSKAKKGKFIRISFHEITSAAIKKAVDNPQKVNMNLVDAQQARRVLDRIVGYKLSPLLWRKVRQGLSAGRVQSVTVRLIVEREREINEFVSGKIEKFKKQKYCRLWVVFQTKEKKEFMAELVKINDRAVEVKELHQLFAGNYRVVKTVFKTPSQVEKTISKLSLNPRIEQIRERETLRRPLPPFTTSKIQQTAARRFGWSSKLTMRVAQSLYEKGRITYHRTDSTNLSGQFLSQSRKLIANKFGGKYLPSKPTIYKTKSKLAQEAHEAIRPTNPQKEKLVKADKRQQRLYKLIWQRAVASQMAPAKLAMTRVEIKDDNCLFVTRGSRIVFDGFAKVYPIAFSEVSLPKLEEKEKLRYSHLGITNHQTQPPPRYTEASLIAALEKEGIGRPSTYASIISIIQQRSYVEKEEKKFLPTNLGIAVNDFLVQQFPDILGLPFTAQMEDGFDKVALGKKDWMKVVGKFWKPFVKRTEKVKVKSERVKIATEKTGEKCPKCKKGDLVIRVGRYGKFIACSRYPECRYTKPLIQEAGFACLECGAPAVIRKTKKGRQFYGCSNWPGCKWASWKKPKQ